MSLRYANRRDVTRVIRNGRKCLLPLGRISSLPASGPAGRILFVVAKTVSKKSTARNRIKRILTAWARERNVGALGHDLVVFVNPGLAVLSPQVIRAAAEVMAERLARSGPHARNRRPM